MSFSAVPALYVANPAVFWLYTTDRITGCVIECGDGYRSAVPVCYYFFFLFLIEQNIRMHFSLR
ncbi:uncharacterized protein ZBIST_5111 [Zygosaccharomyces bailii]|nr:uncharacterized protein ZBIST_5111 [Zygosaccharomyces bailii]